MAEENNISKVNQYRVSEYKSRINRVLDYIESNITHELTLEKLAKIANFSPFHFHRIFRAIVGETLNQFIQRIRLERAAMKLLENQNISITEIALDCGFSGSSAFARAFGDYFGVNASQWRAGAYLKFSKNGKIIRNNQQTIDKNRKDLEFSSYYIASEFNVSLQKLIWRITMKEKPKLQTEVVVKDLPDMPVAYIRHIGPYKGDSQLFERLIGDLCRWAGPRGLLQFPKTQFICVYHDNPEVTDDEKLRLSVCITVPEDTKVDGEVGKMTIPAGAYAMARFELKDDEYQEAWNMVYGGWLPESGYQPDDRPCFEIYLNDPKTHPENKCIVDICVPVKPL